MFNTQLTSELISLNNCLTSYVCIYSRRNLEFRLFKINQITTKLARLEFNKISNLVNTTHLV